MQASKQFAKLPKAGQAIMTAYANDGNKSKLFSSIRANVLTQNTVKSTSVRRSIFRGLLRNHFDMSETDLSPIEATEEQKQAYFDSNNTGFARQTESTLNKALLKKLLKVQILKLLITSGLRVSEILDNDSKIEDGIISFKLNKKVGSEWFTVHTVIPSKKWYIAYKRMKTSYAGKTSTGIVGGLNKMIKTIVPASFYKKSTHICRAIYIKYQYKHNNPNGLPMPQLIQKYLNHANAVSSIHYNYVKLDDDVDEFL